MDEHELPSEDSSDEDYVPGGVASGVSSEESCGEENVSGGDSDSEAKVNGRKRGKTDTKKKSRKKRRTKEKDEPTSESVNEDKEEGKGPEENEEEKKKKADALWADFMKDCGPPVKKNTSASDNSTKTVEEKKQNGAVKKEEKEAENKVKVTQIFEFAGEKVAVEKEAARSEVRPGRGGGGGGGGLSGLLGRLNRRTQLSTLEKSRLDWEAFKGREGINEEIEVHNRGRNGYLEKQDFLERTDLRQFELEKEMRSTRRSKR